MSVFGLIRIEPAYSFVAARSSIEYFPHIGHLVDGPHLFAFVPEEVFVLTGATVDANCVHLHAILQAHERATHHSPQLYKYHYPEKLGRNGWFLLLPLIP